MKTAPSRAYTAPHQSNIRIAGRDPCMSKESGIEAGAEVESVVNGVFQCGAQEFQRCYLKS